MSGIYESLVPEISARQLEDILAECDKRDLAAMNKRMDYYRNELEPVHPQSMSEDTWRDRRDNWTSIPLAQLLVDAIATGLYNREVERTTGNEAYDKALTPVWDKLILTMPQNCRLASVVGDTVLRLAPDWRDGVRVSVWDGRHVIPIYDPDDPQTIIGLVYDYVADPVASQIARVVKGTGAAEARMEIITRHIRNPLTGAIEQPGIRARFIDGRRVPWEADTDTDAYNPFGDFLDGVFWRNEMDVTAARGVPDLEHLLPMLQAVNESTTDARLLLLWNLYPIIATTADLEEQPDYSHKAVWALGALPNGSPADVKMLEWSQNLEGFKTHFEHLLALIHETARIPSIATGDLTHIGELSSGRAYEIALRPYLDMIAEREKLCSIQEIELMRTMIAVLAYMGKAPFTGLTTNYGLGFDQPDPIRIDEATAEASVTFEPVRVAEDAAIAAQAHSTRIGAGFESVETAIRETHPDWSDDDVREELERVGAGKAAEVDASADLRIAQQRQELANAGSGKPTPA